MIDQGSFIPRKFYFTWRNNISEPAWYLFNNLLNCAPYLTEPYDSVSPARVTNNLKSCLLLYLISPSKIAWKFPLKFTVVSAIYRASRKYKTRNRFLEPIGRTCDPKKIHYSLIKVKYLSFWWASNLFTFFTTYWICPINTQKQATSGSR